MSRSFEHSYTVRDAKTRQFANVQNFVSYSHRLLFNSTFVALRMETQYWGDRMVRGCDVGKYCNKGRSSVICYLLKAKVGRGKATEWKQAGHRGCFRVSRLATGILF